MEGTRNQKKKEPETNLAEVRDLDREERGKRGNLVDKWDEKIISDVTNGIPMEYIGDYIENLTDTMQLQDHGLAQEFSNIIKRLAKSCTELRATTQVTGKINPTTSMHGIFSCVKEADGTVSIAYAIHTVDFKMQDKVSIVLQHNKEGLSVSDLWSNTPQTEVLGLLREKVDPGMDMARYQKKHTLSALKSLGLTLEPPPTERVGGGAGTNRGGQYQKSGAAGFEEPKNIGRGAHGANAAIGEGCGSQGYHPPTNVGKYSHQSNPETNERSQPSKQNSTGRGVHGANMAIGGGGRSGGIQQSTNVRNNRYQDPFGTNTNSLHQGNYSNFRGDRDENKAMSGQSEHSGPNRDVGSVPSFPGGDRRENQAPTNVENKRKISHNDGIRVTS